MANSSGYYRNRATGAYMTLQAALAQFPNIAFRTPLAVADLNTLGVDPVFDSPHPTLAANQILQMLPPTQDVLGNWYIAYQAVDATTTMSPPQVVAFKQLLNTQIQNNLNAQFAAVLARGFPFNFSGLLTETGIACSTLTPNTVPGVLTLQMDNSSQVNWLGVNAQAQIYVSQGTPGKPIMLRVFENHNVVMAAIDALVILAATAMWKTNLVFLTSALKEQVNALALNSTGTAVQMTTVAWPTTSMAINGPLIPSAILPAQVTGVILTAASDASLTAGWTAPTTGGGAASNYTVAYRVTGTTTWILASSSITTLNYTLTGLTPATSYDVQITASNTGGSGAPSITVTTSTLMMVPSQILSLTAGSLTSTTAAFTWAVPSTGGTPSSYTLAYRVTGTTAWTSAPTTITTPSYTLTGLTQATSYDIEVLATDAAGTGPASAILTITTLIATPGQVTGLASGTPAANSLPLTWTAPSTGGTPADYTVQYRVSGTTAWTTASSSITTLSFTLTGLTASTSYDLQVIATNAGGSGTPSSVLTISTAA